MAKQVGLFGLRGKIENKSFYKTAGVPETVIRGIPEGLSQRVKTADEYANTRLNNAEFKTGNWIASFLFNAVPSRKQTMMRRFAIAQMTKKALEFIKAGTGVWGARIPSLRFDQIAVDLLENHAKMGPYQGEFGSISITAAANPASTSEINIVMDATRATELLADGIDKVMIVWLRGAMSEEVVSGEVHEHFGHSLPSPVVPQTITAEGVTFPTLSFNPDAAGLGMSQQGYAATQSSPNGGYFAVVSFIPLRTIGGQVHAILEKATYATVGFGAIPED